MQERTTAALGDATTSGCISVCLLPAQEKKTKQVVMGKLGMSDSFAEISLLEEEPITCSIVTATDMELGVVKPERLHGKWGSFVFCFCEAYHCGEFVHIICIPLQYRFAPSFLLLFLMLGFCCCFAQCGTHRTYTSQMLKNCSCWKSTNLNFHLCVCVHVLYWHCDPMCVCVCIHDHVCTGILPCFV